MINNINTGNSGGYLYVAIHGHSGTPYINPNSSNPATGMLRMNGNTLEAFDGSCWLNVGMTNAEISLNQSAIVALDWATKKMVEEMDRYLSRIPCGQERYCGRCTCSV